MEARGFWAVVLVAAVAAIPAARGVWLDLPNMGSKCVSEELHTSNAVVMIHYYAFVGEDYDANSTYTLSITAEVTSPYGNSLFRREKESHGEFAFTTTELGSYMACFSLNSDHQGKKVTVGIEWQTGIAAKDYSSVAKKEKIEGLELELKKLEDNVESIHQNLIHMMSREMDTRQVSDETNGRVARYSLMSLGLCILVSLAQSLYLRRYFQKKKLI